jgi:hypothetical protein
METITDIANDNMEMEPGWHVASSEYKKHPLLDFYLHKEDGYPFAFGRGNAKRLLLALDADKARFVALVSAFVHESNWKEILGETKSSEAPETQGQQTGSGWDVGSDTFKQHELLEFSLDENDQYPFTFGHGKAVRLYGALVANPSKFYGLITSFVDVGDWQKLCVKGVYSRKWQDKEKNTNTKDGGTVMRKVIQAMERADLRELVKKLQDDT